MNKISQITGMIAILLVSLTAMGQRTVTGRIVDQETDKPVSDAVITLNEGGVQAISNSLGYFEMEADSGAIAQISSAGYDDILIKIPAAGLFKVALEKSEPEPILGGVDISRRWKDGEEAFRRFIAGKIRYPVTSMLNGSCGLSVSRITVTPQGELSDIAILMPVDPSIDEEVKRALKETRGHWLPCDSASAAHVFFVQLKFLVEGGCNKNMELDHPGKESFNFIDPVEINAVSVTQKRMIRSEIRRR